MDTKLHELTEKIYREGVLKGQEDADKILADTNAQKLSILKAAEEEAGRIIADAEKQASAVKKNAEAELKLYAVRFVEGLKSDIVNLVCRKIISSGIAPVVSDKDFIRDVILEMVKSWAGGEKLIIQAKEADKLTEYFGSKIDDLFYGKVILEKTEGKSASFIISPADGSYKVSFGEEEFIEFFKDYLRPQLAKMLF